MKTYRFESTFPYQPDNDLFSQVLDKANAYIADTCPNRNETIAIPRTITYLRGLMEDCAAQATDNHRWVCDHADEEEDYTRDPSTCTAEECSQHWDAWQTNDTITHCCEMLINNFMQVVTEICGKMILQEFEESRHIGEPEFNFEDFLNLDLDKIDTTPRDVITVLYAREDHPERNGDMKPLYYHKCGRCDAVLVYIPANTPTEYPSTENPRFAVWDDSHKDLGCVFVDVFSKWIYRQTEDRSWMDPLDGVKVLSVIRGV